MKTSQFLSAFLTTNVVLAAQAVVSGTPSGSLSNNRGLESANEWTPLGGPIDGYEYDRVGTSVDISVDGTVIAVGSPGINNGQARVFEYDTSNSTWLQLGQTLEAEDKADEMGDRYGDNVALSANGDMLAVADPYNEIEGLSYNGHVQIFQLSNNTWQQVGQDIDGEDCDGESDFSLAFSGDGQTVAVGFVNGDYIRVYKYNNTENMWLPWGERIYEDFFGGKTIALSMDGTILTVFSSGYSKDAFLRGFLAPTDASSEWVNSDQQVYLGTACRGEAISMSRDGHTIAVGNECNETVNVYKFSPDDSTWASFVVEWGDASEMNSRRTNEVALSGDGTTLAIEIEGTSELSGGIRVFNYLEEVGWIQVGNEIIADFLDREMSIELSENGNELVVGDRRFNDSAGRVQVYQFKAPTEAPTLTPTEAPTPMPSMAPTTAPTARPIEAPSLKPTESPTTNPPIEPTSIIFTFLSDYFQVVMSWILSWFGL